VGVVDFPCAGGAACPHGRAAGGKFIERVVEDEGEIGLGRWGARRWLDYYAILGVTPQASAEEIKSGYRKRSLSAHPDAGGSHATFLIVNQAYEFLRDKNVRAAYDAARQPAATPMVIHHWQQAAQPAAKSAATVTEHFEHDLKGFDAWLDSLKKDFAAASYGTKQEGRYNFPTVAGSKSGAAFIWLGRAIGAAGASPWLLRPWMKSGRATGRIFEKSGISRCAQDFSNGSGRVSPSSCTKRFAIQSSLSGRKRLFTHAFAGRNCGCRSSSARWQ
jgi:curved DNA-binding protein CbpA